MDEPENQNPTGPRIYGNMIGAGLSDDEDLDDEEDDIIDIQSENELDDFDTNAHILKNRNHSIADDPENIEDFHPEAESEVS